MIKWVLSWFGLAPPPWLLPVVICGAFVLGCFSSYIYGRMDGASKCEAEQLRAELASMKRDKEAAEEAQRTADAIAKALAATNTKLQQEANAYEAELATRPESSACRLNSHDVERLR